MKEANVQMMKSRRMMEATAGVIAFSSAAGGVSPRMFGVRSSLDEFAAAPVAELLDVSLLLLGFVVRESAILL